MALHLQFQPEMKTETRLIEAGLIVTGILAGSSFLLGGCASMQPEEEIAVSGPTILNPRSKPNQIELSRALIPNQKPEVLADVKDFRAPVHDVSLKFEKVPLSIPMDNIGGTTWRGVLTTKQLQMLAVSGKTVKYDASIVARDEQGQIAMAENAISISVKTPDLSRTAG